MSNKNISFITSVALPLITVVVTIGLFFLFKKEHAGSLFWINLCYTLILESLFFTYLEVLRKGYKSFSAALYAVLGTGALIYTITGIAWMLLYSFVLTPSVSIKVYIAVIIILSLIWFVLAVLIGRNDATYKESTEQLKTSQHTLQYYTEKMKVLCSKYEKICNEKGLEYKTDSNNKTVLNHLANKIAFLTPNVLNNELTVSKLNSIIDKCGEIINETTAAGEEEKEALRKKMVDFVAESVDEIELIKTVNRR